MKKKAKCFFCYSWDNMEYYDFLLFLKDKVETESNHTINVTLDRQSYKYNEDLDEKIKKIWEYDLNVCFLTPEFKCVVEKPELNCDRDLIKEYIEIEKRFNEDSHSVFPVVLSGTKEEALPKLFNRKIYPDLSSLQTKLENKNTDFSLVFKKSVLLDKFVSDLIAQVKYNFMYKSVEYKTAYQALDKLFHLTDTDELPTSCLVKIDIYPEIINQKYYFIAGRKGSGKSTFITNFKKIDQKRFVENYKQMIPIYAENIDHDIVYEGLYKKHIGDKHIIPPRNILYIFWELYFILQSILIISREYEDKIFHSDKRKSTFEKMMNKLKELLSLKDRSLKSDNIPNLIFFLVINSIDGHFSKAIDNESAENNLLMSLVANMNVTNILESLFGEKLLLEFVKALNQCERRIIIALDGFDGYADEFRKSTKKYPKDSDEYVQRELYETLFYRTLIDVVTKYKKKKAIDYIVSTFENYLDFCIVLPKDRYDEIIKEDRDSAKKNFCSLVWDAYDLLELIVRRLEYLIKKIDSSVKVNLDKNIFERFDTALDFFSIIPKTVSINIDGHNMKCSLFNYILRFSFWRPRDVISHFSRILAYAVTYGENGTIVLKNNIEPIDNEILKLTIKSNSKKIIQEELIKEYKNVFENLNDVLNQFIDKDLIMPANEFCSQLSKIRFITSFTYDLDKVDNKLYVLYQLGLIGLYFDKNTAKLLGYSHHTCFVFNSGLSPIQDFKSRGNYETAKAKIIFNPILSEKLTLNIQSNELLCDWSEEYINTLHSMKSSLLTSL